MSVYDLTYNDHLAAYYGGVLRLDIFQPMTRDPEYPKLMAEIREHILHIQKQCKDCLKRNVIPDIKENLLSLGLHCNQSTVIVNLLIKGLDLDDPMQLYFATRQKVFFLCMCFGMEDVFDWYWYSMDLAPKRKKGEDLIFMEGLYQCIRTHKLKRISDMTFYYEDKIRGTVSNTGDWVSGLVFNDRGGCKYTHVQEPLGWHPVSKQRQAYLRELSGHQAF